MTIMWRPCGPSRAFGRIRASRSAAWTARAAPATWPGPASSTGHQLYIAPDGTYIPYGDAAEDAANQAVLAAHRENVETLLSRAREIWGIP